MGHPLGTFMGMPIVASPDSLNEGFAVVSLNGHGPTAEYHAVSWHPVHGIREARIPIRDLMADLSALHGWPLGAPIDG